MAVDRILYPLSDEAHQPYQYLIFYIPVLEWKSLKASDCWSLKRTFYCFPHKFISSVWLGSIYDASWPDRSSDNAEFTDEWWQWEQLKRIITCKKRFLLFFYSGTGCIFFFLCQRLPSPAALRSPLVRSSICLFHSCEHNNSKTPAGNFLTFGTNIHRDSTTSWLDFFGGQVQGHRKPINQLVWL